MVAEARWRKSGLSPDPDPADDMLTQALYRRWQHQWFNQCFADTGVHVDEAFPLSEAQALVMGMEANQPYLTEADRLVSEQILNTINLWPTIWALLRDWIYHSTRHYQQQVPVDSQVASVQGDQAAPMQPDFVKDNGENRSKFRKFKRNFMRNRLGRSALLLPALPVLPLVGIGLLGHGIYKNIKKKSSTHKQDSSTHRPGSLLCRQLDKSTAFQTRAASTVLKTQFFDSQQKPALYRLSVHDIHVKTDGNIELIEFRGISGFETVPPAASWPEQGPILLSQEQTMASVTVKAGDWVNLPSLNPDETIILLRTEPVASCQIRKDRYTGMHMVNFPELPKNQNIKVDYVVESRVQRTSST